MAKIIISDLHTADSETYLTVMNDIDSMFVYGGDDYALSELINFAYKFLDFVVAIFGIYNIALLAKSFNASESNSSLSIYL
ncbi:hypothetical protein A6770_20715 [Nostoc minutum NIES-26]|uniref:Uncharacterized protein n=1 Tax=Nostoc minutum NIES-26 TaxID=1844469 RepID=A0A367R3B9_9NOSO|nr:hypothetical protein [Dendronalium sp. ChiSLP03b]MDZ8203758.1 hypothetical protein [Dendronalium sp. ChiSLP03b]RCJ30947.1 hypothetical protein A6770_20715 [Nostoc minutum NIES-26]